MFDSEIDLQVHLKETHKSETETLLEDTNTTSDVSETLSLEEQSEQSQLENDLEKPKCEVCGKEEISIIEMIEHKKTHNF